MPQKSKDHKPVSRTALRVREKIAENVLALMNHEYRGAKYRNQSDREKALAKDAGCSWSTIQRILAPTKNGGRAEPGEGVGAKVDTIVDIAVVFGISHTDLQTPNFATQYLSSKLPPGPVRTDEDKRHVD